MLVSLPLNKQEEFGVSADEGVGDSHCKLHMVMGLNQQLLFSNQPCSQSFSQMDK